MLEYMSKAKLLYSYIFSGGSMEKNVELTLIYETYKSGEDVYLGCYCYPQACHCDVIANKLRSRLIKEKLNKARSSMKKV